MFMCMGDCPIQLFVWHLYILYYSNHVCLDKDHQSKRHIEMVKFHSYGVVWQASYRPFRKRDMCDKVQMYNIFVAVNYIAIASNFQLYPIASGAWGSVVNQWHLLHQVILASLRPSWDPLKQVHTWVCYQLSSQRH